MKQRILASTAFVCLAAAPAYAQEVINTPILSSVSNFRDLAGVSASEGGSGLSYTTTNGGEMRTGVFYRANALSSVSAKDEATLNTLGITGVIDLRTPQEISGAPEVQNVPTGASYTNISVFGNTIPAVNLSSSAAAEATLEAMNQGFVTNASERTQLATVFSDLADANGPMIYNCSSGKDRTGWVSAMLQSIAGVSSSDIMANYLATNTYSAASINAAAAANPAYGTILGVQAPDLQAGLDQIITSYGSLDNYLIEGLGMTQAEIYVLRAKMVFYATLPGADKYFGNAAGGVALLTALQNSSLSGHYTTYNYYLQSAIDAGTLGGVPAQVGGQVIADTGSYLARLPQAINTAIAPYTSGTNLAAGQTQIWEANLAGVLSTNADQNVASTTSNSAGALVGATHRINTQTSIVGGIGYNWGSVRTAGGNAQVNMFLTTVGARYAFSTLENGPYIAGGANADIIVSMHDRRDVGGGIGSVFGNSNGSVFNGHFAVGDVIPADGAIFTPQLAADVSYAHLNGFTEQGAGIPLRFSAINETLPSLTASVQMALPGQSVGSWSVSPTAGLAFTRLLSSPVVTSRGDFEGFGVTQISAFNSRNIGSLNVAVTAQRGPLGLSAGVTGLVGDANSSTGIAGNLAVTYRF